MATDIYPDALTRAILTLARWGLERERREAAEADDPDPEDLVTVPRTADPRDGEGAAA